ncbi:amino acid adenylation domain-containing protein [Aquimarina sp. MMG015]|uniref:non-ribosomal peptide synthetase n=1 Tax=Aquimarina sp. MMG015 TaxID=2822689 RepID=UPI001B3A63A3|nr:non-ribosomal peptide synthetase [Aquimarina sp. MMG015]MBQ4803343.1 amino acid adenylation domain-containing protein [Aquimarina sp. MMG015]
MNKKLIHSLFEGKVEQYKTNVAIESALGNFTYDQLNNITNKIAFLLRNYSNKQDCVATYFNQELFYIFSIIGVFKSGGIYVPVDKKYKRNHWRELFETVQPQVILTSKEHITDIETFSEIFNYKVPNIILFDWKENSLDFWYYKKEEEKKIDVAAFNKNITLPEMTGEEANYIFFTSGSTGSPKMVLGKHKSLSHFIHWESEAFEVTEKDRVGQFTSFSFDASLRDVFLPLVNGGTICIPPQEIRANIVKLCQWMRKSKITLIHTVPTFFRLLLSEDNTTEEFHLRHVFLAGEKLYKRDVINWQNKYGNKTKITNFYGATESTLIKTFYTVKEKITGDFSDPLSVGKPISKTVILILNSNNKLCRIGEKGEIFIKTPFLSKGYFKNPIETSKRFLQNPLSSTPDIIYKTGDFGQYDKDRNIIVLGRKDAIVKLNGVRIDLNSIEQVILSIEEIADVKCILHDRGEDSNLVCFYKANVNLDKAVQVHCSEFLSFYEVPSLYIHLEDFPTNANGKVDIQALKNKIKEQRTQKVKRTNWSKIQEDIVNIWQSILKIDTISIEDNFFLIGGQSINAIQLIAAYQKFFEVELNLNDIFENPVLESHEYLILKSKKKDYIEIKKNEIVDKIPLSFSQKSIWTACQLFGSETYNMPSYIKLPSDIDQELFEKAVYKTIERHEILRTVFKQHGEETYQSVISNEDFNFKIKYTDFSEKLDAEKNAMVYVNNDSYIPFDLEKGPLIRATVIKIDQNYSLFYYNMHHLISDAESIKLLSSDIMSFYNLLNGTRVEAIPELRIQYKDYAIWQNETIKNYNDQEKYWLSIYKNNIPKLTLSIAKSNHVEKYKGKMLYSQINEVLFDKISAFNQANSLTFYIQFYTALSILIYKYSHEKDIVIGSPFSSRSHWDLKEQIGLHLNTLAIRSKIDKKQSLIQYFEDVKKNVLRAQENKDYPFDLLVQNVNTNKGSLTNPIFKVFLVVNHIDVESKLELEQEDPIVETKTKFDISFRFTVLKNKVNYSLIFNNSIFEESDIVNFNKDFLKLLEYIIDNPQTTIAESENILKTEIDQEEHDSFKEQFEAHFSEDF